MNFFATLTFIVNSQFERDRTLNTNQSRLFMTFAQTFVLTMTGEMTWCCFCYYSSVFLKVFGVLKTHAKRDIEHTYQNKRFSVLTISKQKVVCSKLLCHYKYAHIRDTGHAKRVVLACCEHAITFVPVFPWRVTNETLEYLRGASDKECELKKHELELKKTY